jgi:hypothetical protein
MYLRQPENRGGNGSFSITDHGCVFTFPYLASRITFTQLEEHRLPLTPILRTVPSHISQRDQAYLNVLASDNVNLTHSQKELLQWHFRLGHFNLRWIQRLTRVREGDKTAEPILPTRHKSTSSCQLPICAACQFGKAHKQSGDSIQQAKKK